MSDSGGSGVDKNTLQYLNPNEVKKDFVLDDFSHLIPAAGSGFMPLDPQNEEKRPLPAGFLEQLNYLGITSRFRHSSDFRTLWFSNGSKVRLSSKQAQIFQYCYEQFQKGIPEVKEETVLEAIGTEAKRVLDIFSQKKPFFRKHLKPKECPAGYLKIIF